MSPCHLIVVAPAICCSLITTPCKRIPSLTDNSLLPSPFLNLNRQNWCEGGDESRKENPFSWRTPRLEKAPQMLRAGPRVRAKLSSATFDSMATAVEDPPYWR